MLKKAWTNIGLYYCSSEPSWSKGILKNKKKLRRKITLVGAQLTQLNFAGDEVTGISSDLLKQIKSSPHDESCIYKHTWNYS